MASDGIQQALNDIRHAYLQHDYILSEKLASETAKNYPDSPEAHAMLCHFQLWKGEHSEAMASLEKAQTLGPDLAITWAALADVASFEGNIESAKQAADRALEIDNTDWWVTARCLGCYHLSDLDAAVNLTEYWCGLYPDSDLAFCLRVDTLRAVNRSEQALVILEEAERKFPDSPVIRWQRATALFKAQRAAEAAELMGSAAAEIKGDFLLLGEYSAMLYFSGRIEEAEATALQAVKISNCATVAMDILANICRTRGQDSDYARWQKMAKEAIPAFRTTSLLHDANTAARNEEYTRVVELVDTALPQLVPTLRGAALEIKARALVELNELDYAMSILDSLEALGRQTAATFSLRGNILAQRDDHQSAVVVFRKGISQFVYSGILRAGLIDSLHSLGANNELRVFIEDTMSHLPQVACEYAELAMALDKAGFEDDYRAILALGLEKFPGEELLLMLLAVEMAEDGDFAGASRVAGNFKGDMRFFSDAINKADSFVSEVENIVATLSEQSDKEKKPPTLN